MWEVFIEYNGEVLFTFDTEKEALECCNFYGWSINYDGFGNEGFEYDIDYREVYNGTTKYV